MVDGQAERPAQGLNPGRDQPPDGKEATADERVIPARPDRPPATTVTEQRSPEKRRQQQADTGAEPTRQILSPAQPSAHTR